MHFLNTRHTNHDRFRRANVLNITYVTNVNDLWSVEKVTNEVKIISIVHKLKNYFTIDIKLWKFYSCLKCDTDRIRTCHHPVQWYTLLKQYKLHYRTTGCILAGSSSHSSQTIFRKPYLENHIHLFISSNTTHTKKQVCFA